MSYMLIPSPLPAAISRAPTVVSSPPSPQLVQHVSSSENPEGLGITGNNFTFILPNDCGTGNCLVIGITYPRANTVTSITLNGSSIGAAIVVADGGIGGTKYNSAIYVVPNLTSGTTTLVFNFNAAIIPFQFTISEFSGIATTSPAVASSANAFQAGASLSCGSITPTNNDSGGGNLIWSYFASGDGTTVIPSGWAPANTPTHTLLDADIAFTSNGRFSHATQWITQTTAAAINPSITTTGSTSPYNGVTVALKVASAGTPKPSTGLWVNKLIFQTSNSPSSFPWTVQFPCVGNLRLICAALPVGPGSGFLNITGVTDSEGNTWKKLVTDGFPPFFVPGDGGGNPKTTSPNSALTLTFAGDISLGTPPITWFLYDISGAATSPIGNVGTSGVIANLNSATVMNNSPNFTPNANGMVIATAAIANGPVTGFNTGAPANARWDATNYTGKLDTDLMDNADGIAHLFNAGISAETWNWVITSRNPNSSAGATAVLINPA